jgi:hypothetical protein
LEKKSDLHLSKLNVMNTLRPSPILRFCLWLVFALLSPLLMTAQAWLSEGQAWQYFGEAGWFYDEGIHTLRVEGDTLVQGILCKQVTHFGVDSPPKTRYAYTDEGSVFVFSPQAQAFLKLYDFNLAAGDTVVIDSEKLYRIDSTGTMSAAGAERKFQLITLDANVLEQGRYLLVEGMGMVANLSAESYEACSYFFFHDDFCLLGIDGMNLYFECFCEGSDCYDPYSYCTLTSSASIPNPGGLLLSPNPARDYFTITASGYLQGPGLLSLFDATGRRCYQQAIAELSSPLEVATENLRDGTYFLLLRSSEATAWGRVVVQSGR